MSKLEQQTKPRLTALDEAAKSGKELNLSRSDALTVARWAMKTAITHELTVKGPKVATVSMGGRLREGKTIRGSMVWAARNQQDLDLQIRCAHMEISDSPVVRDSDPYRLAILTALTWHHLTLLAYVDQAPGRLGPNLPFDRWTRVWPCPGSGIEYPPMTVVTLSELNSRLSDHRYWLPVVHNFGVRKGT